MAKREEVIDVCRGYDNLFEGHHRVSITVETQGRHMTDEHIRYLNDHSDHTCPFYAPEDYDIVVSERIKELTADPTKFLLKEGGTSMRRAIVATLRVPGRPHQRSAEAKTRHNRRIQINKREKAKARKQAARERSGASKGTKSACIVHNQCQLVECRLI